MLFYKSLRQQCEQQSAMFVSLPLLALVACSAALKCWHLDMKLDFKSVRDKGLVNCPDNHTYCIYQSVTAFLPREKIRYPVSVETTRCGSGWNYEKEHAEKYLGLVRENICKKKLKLPQKWNFTLLPRADDAFRLVERLNEVRCCSTDGCNEADYKLVGGGSDGIPWYRMLYNWFRSVVF